MARNARAVLFGGRGDDTLTGTALADFLLGGANRDALDGGAGDDFLFGDAGADLLNGGDGKDRIQGGAGNDGLYGGSGADVVVGGKGADVVDGGDGRDRLFGGKGSDDIIGGKGKDVLGGNKGADDFIYKSASESTKKSMDVIKGFDGTGRKGGDKIDLSKIDAVLGKKGNQKFDFGDGKGKGDLWARDSGDDTIIYGNIDGDKKAELWIRIDDGRKIGADSYIEADIIP